MVSKKLSQKSLIILTAIEAYIKQDLEQCDLALAQMTHAESITILLDFISFLDDESLNVVTETIIPRLRKEAMESEIE